MLNTDQVLNEFGQKLVDEIKFALANKNLTGYGPSIATGNLSKSIRYEVHDNELQVLASNYIEFLQYGRRPTSGSGSGNGRPLREIIREWIDVKGIVPDGKTSKDSLAYLIARKIHNEGTTIYRKNNGGPSGLLDEIINDDIIKELEKVLIFAYTQVIKSEIMRVVPKEMQKEAVV